MENIDDLVKWLDKRHQDIIACERDALSELKKNNIEAYNEKMRQKAQMLADLAYEAKPYLASAPPAKRMDIEHALDTFSRSAATALNIGSVFYMSALLYNDEHKTGEPDNLELFIERLKKK